MKPSTLTLYILMACRYRKQAQQSRLIDGAWKATSITCSRMAHTLIRTWRVLLRNLIGVEVSA